MLKELREMAKKEMIERLCNEGRRDAKRAAVDASTEYRFRIGNRKESSRAASWEYARELERQTIDGAISNKEAEREYINLYLEALKEAGQILNYYDNL